MQRRAKLNIHCVDTYEEHLCVMHLLQFYLVFSVRQNASETGERLNSSYKLSLLRGFKKSKTLVGNHACKNFNKDY
jgi:hypothetical protein